MALKYMYIIVDGPTEEGALKKRFYKDYNESPSFRIGPGNGKDFSISGYAKGVLPTLKFVLSSDARAVILIPDFEKRRMKFENFKDKLKKECVKLLVNQSQFKQEDLNSRIFVCPPNIMFENWIVSDIEQLSTDCFQFDEKVDQEDFDGSHGCSILEKNMNCKYKKTVHGPLLFKKTDFETSAINSDSFAEFKKVFDEIKDEHCA